MEEKKINHFIAGGIVGAISILFSVVLIITDQMQNQQLGWIGTFIMVLVLIYFIVLYGKSNAHSLGFGELFSFGFKSSAFSTIIILLFQVIFFFHVAFRIEENNFPNRSLCISVASQTFWFFF
jgi:hypothetical protein